MAREHNIDLRQVRGTGAGGRITKADVEGYVQGGAQQPAAPAAPAPAAPAPQPQAAPPPMPRGEQAKTRIEPMSNMRQKIAEHMIFSKRTSAHVTTVHKVDMTKIAKIRAKQKEQFQAQYGFGLTYLPFVARATTEALRAFPIVNASIEGTNIVYHNEINLGIAVALDGGSGLIVPVIRAADEKNVVGLQRSIVDLAARARSRQLKPDEVAGGTFSITNFGSFGSVFATPVINQPQVAILGVGAIEKVPVVIDDAIAIRSVAYIALTFDHRLVDGALADQFVQKIKEVLENWTDSIL
jgi:pyruvate dehydrogenase E2 component (dihydrolipoamide acetyltransferase)